jgi:8-oxo-dGTP pyrophosphatase MutT (NUDIX family)
LLGADALNRLVPDPAWLAALTASAHQPPHQPRVPLLCGEHTVGSVEPEFLSQIGLQPLSNGRLLLQKEKHEGGVAWRIHGDLSASLSQVALALRGQSPYVAAQWRDEALAVWGDAGQTVGQVERGAVRPLGIATQAVHLVGQAADGRIWVQQRALNKANDPGLWDTLMGGMVSAADTVATALVRETWEEAGLRVNDLQSVAPGGRVTLRRPTEPGSAGYMVEQIDWFKAVVPDGLAPVNQDGEVAQFALLDRAELLHRLAQNQFTTEAALILVAALQR